MICRRYARPKQLWYHVYNDHICNEFDRCQWGGLEGKGPGCKIVRPRMSLLTHVQVS